MGRFVQCASVLGLLFMVSCGKETPQSKVFKMFDSAKDAAAKESALSQMAGLKAQAGKVAPYLVKGMGDETASVRLAAVQAAAALEIDGGAVLKKIGSLATSDSDPQVRAAALQCAVTVAPDDSDTAQMVSDALGHDDLAIAKSAALVLMSKAGNGVDVKDLAGVLLKAVKDGTKEDQAQVVFALSSGLGMLGKKAAAAVPVLNEAATAAKDGKVKAAIKELAAVIQGKSTMEKMTPLLNALMPSPDGGGSDMPGPAPDPAGEIPVVDDMTDDAPPPTGAAPPPADNAPPPADDAPDEE